MAALSVCNSLAAAYTKPSVHVLVVCVYLQCVLECVLVFRMTFSLVCVVPAIFY